MAALRLHNILLHNVMRLPVSFYNVTPTGRILARFSTDIEILDVRLPYYLKIIAPYSFRVRVAFASIVFLILFIRSVSSLKLSFTS